MNHSTQQVEVDQEDEKDNFKKNIKSRKMKTFPVHRKFNSYVHLEYENLVVAVYYLLMQ